MSFVGGMGIFTQLTGLDDKEVSFPYAIMGFRDDTTRRGFPLLILKDSDILCSALYVLG